MKPLVFVIISFDFKVDVDIDPYKIKLNSTVGAGVHDSPSETLATSRKYIKENIKYSID